MRRRRPARRTRASALSAIRCSVARAHLRWLVALGAVLAGCGGSAATRSQEPTPPPVSKVSRTDGDAFNVRGLERSHEEPVLVIAVPPQRLDAFLDRVEKAA